MNFLPLILGFLPSFAWLVFYLKEDPHPEPKKDIIHAFVLGASSTFLVLVLEIIFHEGLNTLGIAKYSFISFLGLAAIEEILKFVSAHHTARRHFNDFDEPVDAMIYMIVAALGFAAVENAAAAFKIPGIAFETTTLRFIGATLLHTLSSGLIGYFWAKSIILKNRNILIRGIIYGSILHAFFNYLIMKFEPVVIPTAFLMIFAIFILYDFEKLKRVKV